MATVSKVQIKVLLSDGKSATINLPAPINSTLTDEDTGEELHPAVFTAIKDAYASDSGATAVSATFSIVKTITTTIADNYTA